MCCFYSGFRLQVLRIPGRFRHSFADLGEHDADFCHEQQGEQYGKHPEGGDDPARSDAGNGHIRGHQVLYDPGLTSYLGDNPAALGGDVCQRDAARGQIGNEADFLKFPLPGEPPGKAK